MNYTHHIGIDISKDTLDFAILQGKNLIKQGVVENNSKGIVSLVTTAKGLIGKDLSQVIFCMEHTGIYNQYLLELLCKQKLNIALESSTQIKKSIGLVRGKSDRIDAVRIAEYAVKNSESLVCWQPPREVIKHLKTLSATRSRLINIKNQLLVPVNEAKAFDKAAARSMKQYSNGPLVALEKAINNINEKIKTMIEADKRLAELFNQITSIEGVGKVTAVEIIITTNEFKDFEDAAKYACYSGVAPFEYRSGSSVRGRTRVSHNANKTVKKLLHMAALSAVKVNADLKAYYIRKVAEGKNKMLVLNAVRRKLIDRIFACVRNKKIYEKNYKYSLHIS